MAAWPTYATLDWGRFSATTGHIVRRTEFDSGEIAQRRINSRQRLIRQVTVSIPHNKRKEFDSWLLSNSTDYNDFPDPWSGEITAFRIRGGRITLTPADSFRDGERHWVGTIELEGTGVR